MDKAIFFSLALIAMIIATIPTWLALLLFRKTTRSRLNIRIHLFYLGSVVLGVITLFASNAELPMGIISAPIQIGIVSLLWSIVLVAAYSGFQYFAHLREGHESK